MIAVASKITPKFQVAPAGPLSSIVYGELVPLPEVLEKDTESVWALWSELAQDGAATERMGL